MKKSTKILLFGGLLLIAVGSVLVATVSSIYGTSKIIQMVKNGDLTMRIGEAYVGITGFFSDIGDDLEDDLSIGYVEKERIAGKEEVKNLDISLTGGSLKVKESEDDSVYLTMKQIGGLKYSIDEDKTLKINQKKKDVINGAGEIILYLPKNMEFEAVHVDLGGGEMDVVEMTAKELEISVGAGQIDMQKMQIERVEVSVGAGEINMEESIVNDLVLDMAMGDAEFSGRIQNGCEISCSMGNVSLDLEDKEEAFDYEIDCEAGEVEIGSIESAGVSFSRKIDNGQGRLISVDCALGNVEINFE